MGYPKKKKKEEAECIEEILFWNLPGSFRFFTLPLEISEKTRLHP